MSHSKLQHILVETTIDYEQPMWRSTTPLCDKAIEITNAKTYVFSDSVLCLGGISDQPVEAWETIFIWYTETRCLKDFNRIDGEQMEFEWKNYPRISLHWEFSRRFKRLSSSKVGSSSCQCTTTLYGERGDTDKCIMNSVSVANCAPRFLLGRWSFLGPGAEKKWYGTYSDKPDGDRDRTAEQMMLNLAESSHQIFRATSALESGEFRSKEQGKKSNH